MEVILTPKNKKCLQEGHCPVCGSEDIEFWDGETEDDIYIYECECRKCHQPFNMVYKLKYDGVVYDTDNEEE